MKNENNDKELLDNCMQVLLAISNAQTFKDQNGDKVILKNYAELAFAQYRMIKGILDTRDMPKRNWDQQKEERYIRNNIEMDQLGEHFHDEGEKD